MSVDGYRAYLLLSTAWKVLGAFYLTPVPDYWRYTVYTDVIEVIIFFIIITVEPRLLELWEEMKNNSR